MIAILTLPQQSDVKEIRMVSSLTTLGHSFEFGGWAGWDTDGPGAAVSEDGRWTAYAWMGKLEVEDRSMKQPRGPIRELLLRGDDERPFDYDPQAEWTAIDGKPRPNGAWKPCTAPLALSPDGRLLARGAKFGAVIEETVTGKRVAALTDVGIENPARAITFSPDGRTVALVRGSRKRFRLFLFDVASRRVRAAATNPASGPWTPRFTHDSRFVVATQPFPAAVRLDGRVAESLPGPSGPAFVQRSDGALKADALVAYQNGRWRSRWIDIDRTPDSPGIEWGRGSMPELGLAEGSGRWFAAPVKAPRDAWNGWKAAVSVTGRNWTELVVPSAHPHKIHASPGGRWILVTHSTTVYAFDTAAPSFLKGG